MIPAPSISLPVLPEVITNFRDKIEDHIISILLDKYEDIFTVERYYETANTSIYEDALNLVSSGVPAYLVRTRRENTEDDNPDEMADSVNTSIEVLISVPVSIEKHVRNISRYAYTMVYLLREELRVNPITSLPKNRRRPFLYLGNRDIFRDKDIDIILAEFQVNYINIQSKING